MRFPFLRCSFVLFLFIQLLPGAWSQRDTLRLALSDAVFLAQSEAPDVVIAKTRLTNSYWAFQSYLANYRPRIDFEAVLPDLDRSISTITLPSGQDAFIDRAQMTNFAGISLRQDIGLTGATVFASTGLRRIDVFETPNTPGSQSYLSTPVVIGFEQPLFQFNPLKWDRETEPLRYEVASRSYAMEMEDVAFGAANLFFDILIAQLNEAAALKDKANADTLLTISRGRFEVGRIAETELLQIELSAMNADAALAQARLDLQSNTERLRNFLGLTTPVFFSCVPPYDIPVFPVDAERALELARQNRAEIVDFDLRVAQARRELAVAKGNRGLNATLSGSFGLSQTAPNLEGAYMDPLDQERIRLGLNIPIADWGKARARVEQALTNQALTEMTVAQEKINFEQEVLLQVQQFDLVRQQVFLAQRAYEVAQKRQEMTRNRYYIGKIGITELNIAISEQDSARRAYIFALRAFWVAYYDLRRTTLFDFETGESLFRELDGLE